LREYVNLNIRSDRKEEIVCKYLLPRYQNVNLMKPIARDIVNLKPHQRIVSKLKDQQEEKEYL